MTNTKNNTISLFIILILITAFRVYHIYTTDFNLFFDEAQYWDWSRTLDFGYYSKPPVVAWVIRLTTEIFGHSEFGIRLGSPIAHFTTAIFIFLIAKKLYDDKTAFLSSIAFITLPSVTLSSSLISTDPFLIMFWAIGIYTFIRANREDGYKWWIFMGIAGGFGMLSKYTMVLFFPSVMIITLWKEKSIKQWFSPKFILCCFVAFIIYSPNIYWNAANGFVSFLHTKDNANLTTSFIHPLKALEFIGGQFGMFGLFFGVLLLLIFKIKTVVKDETSRMLLFFVLPFLGLITTISFLSRSHANWAAPVYVSATVLVIRYLIQNEKFKFIYFAIGLNIFLAIGFYAFNPIVEKFDIQLTKKIDPFKRIRGWKELGETVLLIKTSYPNAILLADSRKLTTELLYYTNPNKVVKWNSNNKIGDHYDLTTKVENGKDYLLITKNSNSIKQIEKLGNKYIEVGIIEIHIYQDFTMKYFVYYIEDIKI